MPHLRIFFGGPWSKSVRTALGSIPLLHNRPLLVLGFRFLVSSLGFRAWDLRYWVGLFEAPSLSSDTL